MDGIRVAECDRWGVYVPPVNSPAKRCNLAANLQAFSVDGDAVRLQPMRPKLAEVAQLAEVSEATVSRVLNGRPGVAEETRRRVLDVMGDLGYRDVPSLVGRSEVVGIVTPELENPVFALFAQSLQSHLASRGMLPVVCSATSETVNEQDYLDHFVSTRAAGAIVVNGRYAQPEIGYGSYVAIRDGGLPLVLVNGIHDPSPLPAIAIDLKTATSAAVRHLVTLGHRRIGMVVGPIRYSTSIEMIEGCRLASDRLGVACDETMISETVLPTRAVRRAAPNSLKKERRGSLRRTI